MIDDEELFIQEQERVIALLSSHGIELPIIGRLVRIVRGQDALISDIDWGA